MWIRQVIIPGITDEEKDLIDLKNFLSTLKTVQKIELNSYHTLGIYKWNQLGVEYPLKNIRPANNDDIIRAKQILGIS